MAQVRRQESLIEIYLLKRKIDLNQKVVTFF